MSEKDSNLPAVVSVAEMARMVGLSRARFYQLQHEGVFPLPVYDIQTRRPIYTEEQQRACLEVRRRNCGINGRPVLFYARRVEQPPRRSQPRVQPRRSGRERQGQHREIVEALRALGLSSATDEQVDAAVRTLFPTGTAGVRQEEVIRAVFVHLRRRDSGDSVGR